MSVSRTNEATPLERLRPVTSITASHARQNWLERPRRPPGDRAPAHRWSPVPDAGVRSVPGRRHWEIGRASGRERVCQYVSVSGGGGSFKKNIYKRLHQYENYNRVQSNN